MNDISGKKDTWVYLTVSDLWFIFITRFTKDSPRFKDELEIMKYICKDFWTAVYKKQIDNLRTNHQVLTCQRLAVT